MRYASVIVWLLLAALASAAAASPGGAAAEDPRVDADALRRLLAAAPRPADAAQLYALNDPGRRLDAAFLATLDGDGLEAGELHALWQPLGLTVDELSFGDDRYWWLHESERDRNGRGAFVLRRPPGPLQHPVLMLHAPHQFSDQHTGRIAAALFWRLRPRALAVNSVPRAWQGSTVGARNHDLYAAALARAVVALEPRSWVVQLHGFSTAKRTSLEGATAAMIVSSGTSQPGPSVRRLASELDARFLGVRLYPEEVNELGGTRSAVGRALRAAGSSRFVHLEMSASTRRSLAEDGVVDALVETLEALQ